MGRAEGGPEVSGAIPEVPQDHLPQCFTMASAVSPLACHRTASHLSASASDTSSQVLRPDTPAQTLQLCDYLS